MDFLDDLDPEGSLSNGVEADVNLDDLDREGWLSNDVEASEASESESADNKSTLSFDPKLIKITVETITIYGIAQRLKYGNIDMYPKFQRKNNLWDDVRKSRLIESLLLRFPLPAFYFNIQDEDKWLVVDGLQRLSTLNHFIVETEKPLILLGLEILKNLEGKSFKQLDITLRRRILDTNLTTFQIQAGTPKEIKYNVFKRINTGGLGLTNMEIRHALNQKGTATNFFEQLTGIENNFFKSFVESNKIVTNRMEDRELVLRYVAFSLQTYTEYKPTLGEFLDQTMEKLDNLTIAECNKLIKNLEKSINCYRNIFGNTRFGRGLTRIAKMNSALFEVWTIELAKLSDAQRERLVVKRDQLKESFRILLSEPIFHKSIVSSTGRVYLRINIILIN